MGHELHDWPENIETVEQLANKGVIRPTDRYVYKKVTIEGETYFYKEANQEDVGLMLDREFLWIDFMSDFEDAYPHIGVRALRAYAYQNRKAIIAEFVEAPFVATPDTIAEVETVLDRYVEFLVTADTFGEHWRPSVELAAPETPYTQLDKRWDTWIEAADLIGKGILLPEQLEEARRIVSDYQTVAEPRVQHGDFVPWHIFDNQGEWIVYDAEHAHYLMPRFYDLTYSYVRFFTRGQNKELADTLLTKFITKSGMDEATFFTKFAPILVSRSIGMLLDAENDDQEVDYRQNAQNLLKLALSSKSIADLTLSK